MLQHRVGKVLKQLMYEHDIDETALSKLSGVSKSNISRMKNDPHSNPTYASLKPIADYFAINVSQLLGEEKIESDEIVKIPHLTLEQVPLWLEKKVLNDEPLHVVSQLSLSKLAFAFTIEQKTLKPLFRYGAVVLCDKQRDFQDGDYVLLQGTKGSDAIIKLLIKEGPNYYLKSLHPDINEVQAVTDKTKLLAYVVEVRYRKS